MLYRQRREGSQRASLPKVINLMELTPNNDGATFQPVLWFRVGGLWRGIEFQTMDEAKQLISSAQHIRSAHDNLRLRTLEPSPWSYQIS